MAGWGGSSSKEQQFCTADGFCSVQAGQRLLPHTDTTSPIPAPAVWGSSWSTQRIQEKKGLQVWTVLQILDFIFHFILLLLFQCWDWTDRSSDHDGDSDVSHWVQSACLSSRYCKNHERSKSHDDPNTCEYHPCCSVLKNNHFPTIHSYWIDFQCTWSYCKDHLYPM